MARPPASPAENLLLASTSYVAFWTVLVAVVAASRPAAPTTLAVAASHARGGAAWAEVAHRVYDEVQRRMPEHAAAQRVRVARTVLEEAARAALDPLLVVAVIQVESAFDPRAVSPVGAAGLMQLRPPTMREELDRWRLGRADPFDPVANVRAGVRYLGRMLAAFDDLELALMAYNAGPGRIRRHLREGGVPERFLTYPRDVKRLRARLAAASARASGVPMRVAAVHAAPAPKADTRGAGGLDVPAAPRRLPSAGPPASFVAAVPTGSRRRDLTDS